MAAAFLYSLFAGAIDGAFQLFAMAGRRRLDALVALAAM